MYLLPTSGSAGMEHNPASLIFIWQCLLLAKVKDLLAAYRSSVQLYTVHYVGRIKGQENYPYP